MIARCNYLHLYHDEALRQVLPQEARPVEGRLVRRVVEDLQELGAPQVEPRRRLVAEEASVKLYKCPTKIINTHMNCG